MLLPVDHHELGAYRQSHLPHLPFAICLNMLDTLFRHDVVVPVQL